MADAFHERGIAISVAELLPGEPRIGTDWAEARGLIRVHPPDLFVIRGKLAGPADAPDYLPVPAFVLGAIGRFGTSGPAFFVGCSSASVLPS